MNLAHNRKSLSQSSRVLLPMSHWKSVQFNVAITRKQIKTTSSPLLRHRRILEAHALPNSQCCILTKRPVVLPRRPFAREGALPQDGEHTKML